MTKKEFEKALNNAIKASKKAEKEAKLEALRAAFNAPRLCAYCGADCTSEIQSPEHKLLAALFNQVKCNSCFESR